MAETEIPSRVRKKLTLATRDHGVDLLLEDHEGRYHAVQCKFKTDQSETLGWTKDRLSSWLAESDEAQGLIMFTNASGIDKQSTLKAAKKDFTLITVGDLVSLSPETIENVLRLAKGKAPKKTKRLKPYPHQRRAINDVVKGFRTHDRGQLILPCGAGKTLASLWLKERLGAKRTLVLVPSLALLRQTRREWAAQQKARLPYLCVCSEKDIDKDKRDVIVTHTFEVPGHVTTQPNEIAAFARKHRELVVYSTYQSLEAVVDAGVKFDLAICDEAHKTATARHNEFALVHEDALKAEKRLYMTATPRVLSPSAKGQLGEDAFEVVADMSDEETFGPEFHRMSFADAIEQGILVDYKIVVVGVTDRHVHKHIEQRTYLEDASADQVATSLALQKAMKKHGAAHALTFHSRVKRAKAFKEIHGKRTRGTKVEHVNGSMSTNDRLVLLDEFKEAPRAVMTNARCLTEGVDVPAIDCVAFADPRHSKVDIVQAAGRTLRIGDETKAYGVILIPVFYQVGEEPEEIASGVFRNVFEVVRAMADHDERLQAEITSLRLGEGKRSVSGSRFVVEPGDEERIVLEGFERQLKRSLRFQVVDKFGLRDWGFRYAELKAYKDKHGHCEVPRSEGALATWVSTQRVAYSDGELSELRIKPLEELGFVWNVLEALWEEQYERLKAFKEEYGHCNPTKTNLGTSTFGRWVNRVRSQRRAGTLEANRIAQLDAIGFVWDHRDALWEKRYNELVAYMEKHGHGTTPASDSGTTLANWCAAQRRRRQNLSQEREARLLAIGFVFDPFEARWNDNLQAFAEYVKSSGDPYPSRYEEETKPLGNWVSNTRVDYRDGKLTEEQIRQLKAVGFAFEVEHQQQFHRGEGHGNAKLTAEQVLEIYSDPRRQVDIAKDYGIKQANVSAIKTGRAWTHVTGAKHRPKKRHLTPKKVLAIYRSPRPYKELAQAHSVNSVTIGDIKNGKTWAHVTGHKTGAAE